MASGQMIDIHCHILPGLDDGAQTMDDAVAMARMAVDDGITTIVATPHHWQEHFTPTPQEIRRSVGEVQDRLTEEGLALKLLPGQEVMMAPNVPELLRRGDLTTLGDGGEYLLIELPTLSVPMCSEDVLLEIMSLGVTPILAHPEKNAVICKEPEMLQGLVQQGCLVQMDADSLLGPRWAGLGRAAANLLTASLVHILASDGHCPASRPPVLSPCADRAADIVSPQVVEDMTTRRPRELMQAAKVTITSALPAPPEREPTRSTTR
jgi:protein-tyrosine phosphatase